MYTQKRTKNDRKKIQQPCSVFCFLFYFYVPEVYSNSTDLMFAPRPYTIVLHLLHYFITRLH